MGKELQGLVCTRPGASLCTSLHSELHRLSHQGRVCNNIRGWTHLNWCGTYAAGTRFWPGRKKINNLFRRKKYLFIRQKVTDFGFLSDATGRVHCALAGTGTQGRAVINHWQSCSSVKTSHHQPVGNKESLSINLAEIPDSLLAAGIAAVLHVALTPWTLRTIAVDTVEGNTKKTLSGSNR